MAILQLKNIALDLCGNEFLLPYLRSQLEIEPDDEPVEATCAVRIITLETESDRDTALEAICSERNLPLAVLCCPYIVGTGMTGLLRRIASGIYKGSYVHITGNDARIGVVHALDVACAVSLMAGSECELSLTDGVEHTIHDLADALACRLGDKRIISIKPRWAKLWYGSDYFGVLTSDHVVDMTFGDFAPDFNPINVVDYLRTHVYSEKDI